jgi:hypothetical protein
MVVSSTPWRHWWHPVMFTRLLILATNRRSYCKTDQCDLSHVKEFLLTRDSVFVHLLKCGVLRYWPRSPVFCRWAES